MQLSVGSGITVPASGAALALVWCCVSWFTWWNSSPGLLAEPVGCGSITKAQTMLEPLTSP